MFVKICGLRTEADVACAVGEGADAVGFVLAPSPRQITVDDVVRLVPVVPESVLTVGVFLGTPAASIAEIVTKTGLGAAQLHGSSYTARDFAELAGLGVTLIRATSVTGEEHVRVGEFGEDMLILDSQRAGSGEQWAWAGLRGQSGQWLLAGGLRPGNVAEAITSVRPWGVDVSSGVEAERGTKDHGLIGEFMAAVRASA